MIKNQKVARIVLLISLFVITLMLFMISVYSPYYSGFERELTYLSADLSENRAVIRDSLYIRRASEVKLVFELKDGSIDYDMLQFYTFLRGLELQIWNDREFYSIDIDNITFFANQPTVVTIPVGILDVSGTYNIYIRSSSGINPTYHIGVGIGNSRKFQPLGDNVRKFF